MLRSVDWQLVADVSGQPIGPIFKGQAFFFDFLNLKYSAIGYPETSETATLSCVTSKKIEYLKWNEVFLFCGCETWFIVLC
jgi:hypothetical protein